MQHSNKYKARKMMMATCAKLKVYLFQSSKANIL